ncbi:hypothetical protein ACS0TY_026839 [Phlomoides rotata]
MRKECGLAEGVEGLDNHPEIKLPFGDWMRASPLKKAVVSIKDYTTPKKHTSVRSRLFEKFKQTMEKENKVMVAPHVEEEISLKMESVAVKKELEVQQRNEKPSQGTDQEMDIGNPTEYGSSNGTLS